MIAHSYFEPDSFLTFPLDVANMSSSLPAHFIPDFHHESEIKKLSYRRLGNTDMVIAPISFGCGRLSAGVEIDEDTDEPLSNFMEAVGTVTQAVKKGINYIDTAPFYGAGKSEIVLGLALKDIPRSAYYLATKVGRRADCEFDFSSANVVQSVNQSLRRLNVDYLDVVQVHDVEFAANTDVIVNQTLPALDQFRKAGKIRYVGVTGYSLKALKEVIEKSTIKIDLVLSYCRQTLFCQELQSFIPFFRGHGLGIINAAVHGMGLLTPITIPDWHPVNDEIRTACAAALEWTKSRGIDLARLALADAIASDQVDTVLVGMQDRAVLNANWEVATIGLTEDEARALELVKEKFFKPIKQTNWEGVELQKLRQDYAAYITFLRSLHSS